MFIKSLPLRTVHDWHAAIEHVRIERYGVVETRAGIPAAIHFRRFPKLMSWPEVWPVNSHYHMPGPCDRCLLYYNQPRRHSSYLALKYIISSRQTRFATVRAALAILDAIASIKQSDAILADAANCRLSERALNRLGWEPHKPQLFHRNYIRRFYGSYPSTNFPLQVS